MSRRSLSLATAVVMTLAVGAAGCTSGATLGSTGTVSLSAPPSPGRTTAATASSSMTLTPVTPNGLLAGAGVTDRTITLGMLVNATEDRGFSTGVALWEKTANSAGGICGRRVQTTANRPSESLAYAYARIAGATLGLITLPSEAETPTLAALSSADQIPTLTLGGSSSTLTRTGPVVIGATADIEAINALAYLRSVGRLPSGSTLGVLTDSSVDAANALAGARWWAARNSVSINAKMVAASTVPTDWGSVRAVLVMAPAAQVVATVDATRNDVDIVTDLRGYDPGTITAPGGRLLVTLPTPAYGSDNPGAAAVAKEFVASGQTSPGAELIAGYGVGAAWGRILTQACSARTLTHQGVVTAMTTVGPASVDSLFGPSDPGLVVGSALPATRVSSIARADPSAPAGLRPLIWLQTAPGIADYVPAR
ncbi:type 1 periplasmic-binding domain-containing protein [Nakamurella panacisegetis]|uniref:hypothetical protein n=1 Tax=Nakamurella panacisegetis TaxID=1090615 RepID=UPI0012FD816E|nr:hypothetical protein [Nakamurella panacisegetis]